MSNLQTSIDTLIATIKQKQEEYRTEQERIINEELGPILARICEEHNIPGVMLYGYTPGFNDGDPCTHRQSTGEWYEGEELHGYQFESDEQEQLGNKIQEGLGSYSNDARRTVEALFEPLEDAFETTFGTNWFLIWEYEPVSKTMVIQRGDYDCGY